jgi:hypothetical protein
MAVRLRWRAATHIRHKGVSDMDQSKKKTLKASLASKGLYNDESKKEKERRVLQEFLQRLQLRYYNIDDRERPDFILQFSHEEWQTSVGCELTHYFMDNGDRGAPEARFVRQWRRFAKSLRAALDSEGGQYRYYYGAIHFRVSSFDVFDRVDSDGLVAEIVRAAKTADGVGPLANFDIKTSPILAQHVHHIYVKDTAPETGIIWWPAHLQTGVIADPRERLVEIVKDKNTKAATFNWNGANEKWLLIYSESGGISDSVGPYADPEIRKYLGRLAFDRVYVWNKFMESIEEIYPGFVTIFDVRSKVLHRSLYPLAIRPFIIGPP